MPSKPIDARTHGLLDYGMPVVHGVLPAVLGLTGRTKAAVLAVGASQAMTSAVTTQPTAVKPFLPHKMHGYAEAASLPIALAVLLRAFAPEGRDRAYVAAMGAGLGAIWLLTDWNAEDGKPGAGDEPQGIPAVPGKP